MAGRRIVFWLPKLLTLAGLVTSTSEGRRLIHQGTVKVGDEKVAYPNINLIPLDGIIIKAEKRKFAKSVL